MGERKDGLLTCQNQSLIRLSLLQADLAERYLQRDDQGNDSHMDSRLITDWMTGAGTAVIAVTGVCALIYAHQQLKQARETEKVKHLVDFIREFEHEPRAGY